MMKLQKQEESWWKFNGKGKFEKAAGNDWTNETETNLDFLFGNIEWNSTLKTKNDTSDFKSSFSVSISDDLSAFATYQYQSDKGSNASVGLKYRF